MEWTLRTGVTLSVQESDNMFRTFTQFGCLKVSSGLVIKVKRNLYRLIRFLTLGTKRLYFTEKSNINLADLSINLLISSSISPWNVFFPPRNDVQYCGLWCWSVSYCFTWQPGPDCLYFTSHITWVMRQQWRGEERLQLFSASRELLLIFIYSSMALGAGVTLKEYAPSNLWSDRSF